MSIKPESLTPGQLLGEQYQIIKPLGTGGMGQVLLANDLTLDRFVAIKILRSDLSHLFDKDARIRREARLLSRLNHPNVVTLYAFGSASPQMHYIVMEYVRGETLEDRRWPRRYLCARHRGVRAHHRAEAVRREQRARSPAGGSAPRRAHLAITAPA